MLRTEHPEDVESGRSLGGVGVLLVAAGVVLARRPHLHVEPECGGFHAEARLGGGLLHARELGQRLPVQLRTCSAGEAHVI